MTAASLLKLMWLASPALPVGAFSYSEGLESAVDAGLAADEPAATRWLVDQLHLVLARAELPLVAAAMRAWQRDDRARLAELNDWALHTRETRELRRQAEQMGHSLAEWLRQRLGSADPRLDTLAALRPVPAWPLAWALAARASGAPAREALLACGFGWAENMVQAAIKAVPLGQSAGQRMLARLVDELPAAADHALALADGERMSHAPMLAILSARHEAQYSRLFRS